MRADFFLFNRCLLLYIHITKCYQIHLLIYQASWYISRHLSCPPPLFGSHPSDMTDYNLTHLKQLEAESIHIIREVAAEFDNPVMLYSIGKDSAVMLHLARKAFYPGKPPFPLLHVDTTWKFREMITIREQMDKKVCMDLIIHINKEGVDQGIGPITRGSSKHAVIMKTAALKQALDKYGFDAAF